MSWATNYINQLKNGDTVSFRPKGNSMKPLIYSGQKVTVKPVSIEELIVDTIVLCKVSGRHYLHLIKAIQGDRYQIGNNRGGINGWVGYNCIYGICIKIED